LIQAAARLALTLLVGCVLALGAVPAEAAQRIALSFDDVPRNPGAFFTPDERTRRLIAALRRARVEQAAFFITTGNLERPFGAGGEARIQAYVAAGHVIANHSHSHLWATRTPVADYLADLDRARAWLSGRPGWRPWYRFPFLDEGRDTTERRDALRRGLAERGLSSGYVTADSYDWFLDNLVNQAHAAGRTIDRDALRDLYVQILVEAANHAERTAVAALGRSPAHMMLLHETDIAALFIADAVAALRRDGWEIVSADAAFSDPIAAIEPDTLYLGGGRVTAIAAAGGADARSLGTQWNDEAFITGEFNRRVLHQTGSQ
jgi:peptidoglycan/xylan/chitin deacetylase (PgdA/CDA1 family)